MQKELIRIADRIAERILKIFFQKITKGIVEKSLNEFLDEIN